MGKLQILLYITAQSSVISSVLQRMRPGIRRSIGHIGDAVTPTPR